MSYKLSSYVSNDSAICIRLDPTHAWPVSVVSNPSVTSFSPSGSPRVLHQVVLLAIFFSKSDCCNSMIGSGSTWRCVYYSSFVIPERSRASRNSDWSWTDLNRVHECILVIGQDVCIAKRLNSIDYSNSSRLISVTRLDASHIWPITRLSSCISSIVVHGTLRPVALTVAVTRNWWSTVDKLLFRKFHQESRLYEISAFCSCCRSKCPARTTLALVFWFIHSTLFDPVNIGANRGSWFLELRILCNSKRVISMRFIAKHCLILFISPSWELVMITLMSDIWIGVEFFKFSVCLLELRLSELMFVCCVERKTMFCQMGVV